MKKFVLALSAAAMALSGTVSVHARPAPPEKDREWMEGMWVPKGCWIIWMPETSSPRGFSPRGVSPRDDRRAVRDQFNAEPIELETVTPGFSQDRHGGWVMICPDGFFGES